MVKAVKRAAALASCAAAGFVLSLCLQPARDRVPRESHMHTGPTVEQVQQLSSLVTTRVEVADVQETRISGHTGGVRAVVVVKGDLLLSVDLARARLEAVDRTARTAVLVLPQPAAASPRVDHERTRLFEVREAGLWLIVPGDEARTEAVNRAFKEAQAVVAAVGEDPALRARAREQAERALGCFYDALGWRVTVRWSGR